MMRLRPASYTVLSLLGLMCMALLLTASDAFAQSAGSVGTFSCSGSQAQGSLYTVGASCPTKLEFDHLFSFLVCNMEELSTNLMGNMFCGYSCIIYSLRGDFESAAPYIGISIVLDMLDGRIARLTGTSSEFGLQLDSLADAISFGVAPAILAYAWGLEPLGRLGMFSGFLFMSAAVLRLARFNVQSAAGGDKRYFVGMPSPAAAGVPAATVYMFSGGLTDYRASLAALAMVLVPAVLMVTTIRFRSFKTLDLHAVVADLTTQQAIIDVGWERSVLE